MTDILSNVNLLLMLASLGYMQKRVDESLNNKKPNHI